MTYAEGGRNDYTHVLPTRMKYPNLVLKRGMTSTTALEDWFKQTKTDPSRIVVTLTMYDEAKTTLRTWSFANAFPVKWAGPSFNAGQAQAATETIEIVHEGIQVL
jgi:phage tail-like protein